MTLKSPVSVRIEAPQASFGDLMNRIRTWLDRWDIAPAEFKSDIARPGAIAIDIRFRSEDDAHLFEREFAAPQAAD
jgi:hypothetical protein